jgi:hypothetical protein
MAKSFLIFKELATKNIGVVTRKWSSVFYQKRVSKSGRKLEEGEEARRTGVRKIADAVG